MDFYCPELKLAIEIDGDSHYTDHAILYDQERQGVIQSYGIHFLRFTNKEICNNLEGVIKTVGDRIQKITTPPPP
jgi:very-short-patch-repair endonuclease